MQPQPQPFKPGDMAVWTVIESGGPFLPGKTTTTRTVTILESMAKQQWLVGGFATESRCATPATSKN
jgi:hypothetical protein